MFDQLSQNISLAIRRFKGKVTINEQDIKQMMSDLRVALTDADVHLSVIDSLLLELETKSLDQQVIRGIKPAEKIIQLFQDLISNYLGEGEELSFASKPTIVMVVGLQGTGKNNATRKTCETLFEQTSIACGGRHAAPRRHYTIATIGGIDGR
jgi:signal recognition particle subunit SRP54